MHPGDDAIDPLPNVQLAAGGVVWEGRGQGARLALVHRPKYDDWTLPKGKPEPGETLAETAWREVNEEIGQAVDILHFAGVMHYPLRHRNTKVVLFWHMLAKGQSHFAPNREIDAIAWMSLPEAMKKLSYQVEVKLLREVKELELDHRL